MDISSWVINTQNALAPLKRQSKHASQTLRLTDRMHSTSLTGNVRAVVAVSVFVMNEEEHHAEEEADGAHGNVGDAQEGVFPSHPGDGAEDHSLAALEAAHGVVWEASG